MEYAILGPGTETPVTRRLYNGTRKEFPVTQTELYRRGSNYVLF